MELVFHMSKLYTNTTGKTREKTYRVISAVDNFFNPLKNHLKFKWLRFNKFNNHSRHIIQTITVQSGSN